MNTTDYWRERAIRAEKKLKQLLPRVDSLPGKKITGRNYRPSCGKCDVPPWAAECACSFQKEEMEKA